MEREEIYCKLCTNVKYKFIIMTTISEFTAESMINLSYRKQKTEHKNIN